MPSSIAAARLKKRGEKRTCRVLGASAGAGERKSMGGCKSWIARFGRKSISLTLASRAIAANGNSISYEMLKLEMVGKQQRHSTHNFLWDHHSFIHSHNFNTKTMEILSLLYVTGSIPFVSFSPLFFLTDC